MDDRFRSLVYGVALAIMVVYVLDAAQGILIPVVSSILVVYVIVGVSQLIARAPVLGPALSEGARHLLSVALIVVLLVELVALFVANLGAVAVRAPMFQEALLNLVQSVAETLGVEDAPNWDTVRTAIVGEVNVQRTLRVALSSVSALVGGLSFVLLNVAFLLLERRDMAAKLDALAPDPAGSARLRAVIGDVNARVGRYLAVKTMINVMLGVLCWAIMATFGVEFAVFWAIVIAVLNYIPYIGSAVGTALPVALALVQFPDTNTVLLLLAFLVAAQILMGNVIEPQVMGGSLNLSPYVILIALTAWTSLWGVAGAIFSVPITAILVIVFSEFRRTRPLAILLSKDGRLDAPPATPGVGQAG
jgi:predicted PurR-regulated permease PerM